MVRDWLTFRSLEREGIFWSCAFYEHLVPTERGKFLGKKQQVGALYDRGRTDGGLGHNRLDTLPRTSAGHGLSGEFLNVKGDGLSLGCQKRRDAFQYFVMIVM
jgi:hypothetical protein